MNIFKVNTLLYYTISRSKIIKILFLFITLIFINVSDLKSQERGHSFQYPVINYAAEGSLVEKIETAIIIPGDTHEDLWVHPEVVTIPGKPIVVELRTRTTDRHGKDQHTLSHYFRTDDFFTTLHPIEKPSAKAWNRIRLSLEDMNKPEKDELIPEMLGHTWASAYLYVGGDTIIQSFTTLSDGRYSVQSLLAIKERGRFTPIHISNAWTNDAGRGLYEPQIVKYDGKYYMTARAEDGHGYFLISEDYGRSWNEPIPWKWDNGEPIAMHQTMTKLLSHSEGLVLVYTRIRDDNDNVFRNRSPLHIADFNTETLKLDRSTERIIVHNRLQPEIPRGFPVGNFWVWPVNRYKSFVITAEWPRDGVDINGDIWLTKIYWRKPNQLMDEEGRESNF